MMERDVNIKLVYIILILLIALGGTAIFYQIKYDNLRESYEKTFNEYNRTFTNMDSRQRSLYSNISELNVSIDRENALALKLEERNRELEIVTGELAEAQQQLFESQQNLDTLKVSTSYANELLNKHRSIIKNMQTKFDRLRSDVNANKSKDEILDDITALETDLYDLKSS